MSHGADFIRFDSITKRFAGVTALDNVSLSIARGECHGLMGENGAGKSTLGKVLAGIHRADEGKVTIDGAVEHFRSPADARAAGVGMVHQELAFCPELSVAENLCMGVYPRKFGIVDRAAMRAKANDLLSKIGVSLDVSREMRALSTAQEQLVQIAAAVGTGARILVFDEPTSSLSEPEARHLFDLIEQLKSRGVTMIYVSHRMPEVFRLCDRFSVLRDGKYVGTLARAEATEDAVVRMMVGRSVETYRAKATAKSPDPILTVRNLTSRPMFENISFDLKPGEILGFAGLVGAGRSEVAKAVFGLDPRATGHVTVAGQPLPLGSIKAAMRAGIGLVPEDRKRQGLVLMMSGRSNYSMAILERLRRLFMLDQRRERTDAQTAFNQLRVKTPTIDAPVATLSGGNQQKVVIAKWLARGAKVLIVDEPTRGVDVGAKAAIHELLDQLASQGVGIMMISSELPEVLSMSTRILVMRDGRLVGELQRGSTEEQVLRLMAGVGEKAA
jgi:ABC-type sugar transport system ATPase subunit